MRRMFSSVGRQKYTAGTSGMRSRSEARSMCSVTPCFCSSLTLTEKCVGGLRVVCVVCVGAVGRRQVIVVRRVRRGQCQSSRIHAYATHTLTNAAHASNGHTHARASTGHTWHHSPQEWGDDVPAELVVDEDLPAVAPPLARGGRGGGGARPATVGGIEVDELEERACLGWRVH